MKTVAARVDIMGSLLRPPWLKDARERYAAGDISAAEFKRIEDDAVDEAVKLQEKRASRSSPTARCTASLSRASWPRRSKASESLP